MNTLAEKLKKNSFLKNLAAVTAVGIFYFGLVAPTEYTSESKFVIKKAGEDTIQPLSLGLFPASGDSSDIPVVKAYIESPNAAKDLEALSFKTHISENAGIVNGISNDSPFEDYYDRYSNLINIKSDYSEQVVTLNVSAYSPEMALKANKALLNNIEGIINSINENKIKAQFENSERVAREAEQKLNAAIDRLVRLEKEQKSISPESERVSVNETILKLEADLVAVQTELKERRSYLSDSSLDVRTLASKEAALRGKISDMRNNLPSLTSSTLSQKLQFEVEMLTEIYKAATANVDQKRLEAGKESKILVVVSEPIKPETKSYPVYKKDLLNFILLGMILVFIFKFLLISIKNKR